MIRLIGVLTLVCVVAALVLGLVYQTTAPLIAAQKDKETQLALKGVISDADEFKSKELDDSTYYEAYKRNKLIGYIISSTGKGYAGDIEMMVGISKSKIITGVYILNQQETPGLGARCVEIKHNEDTPWFTQQFVNKKIKDIDINNIETITGATITTKAIMHAIRQDVYDFLDKIKK